MIEKLTIPFRRHDLQNTRMNRFPFCVLTMSAAEHRGAGGHGGLCAWCGVGRTATSSPDGFHASQWRMNSNGPVVLPVGFLRDLASSILLTAHQLS